MLEGLHKKGLLLGPIAQHMDRLGSKMILFELQNSTMGVTGVLLHHFDDMKNPAKNEIDRMIPKGGPPRVLKMMRGSTGLGVWKLENKDDKMVNLIDAYDQSSKILPRAGVIPAFMAVCAEDAISMPFLPLIKVSPDFIVSFQYTM